MSNLEFTSKFHKRVSMMFDSEKASEVIDEFDNLDPREANIFYRAFTAEPGTPEHLHSVTRVKALVASGFVSNELASITNDGAISSAREDAERSYMLSREALLDVISDQKVSNDVLTNPYDEDGLLSRMVIRGNTKEEILNYLNSKLFFQAAKELAEAGPDEETTLAGQEAILRFTGLMEAIDNLEDPVEPADFKANAKQLVASYDEDGTIASMIDSGASSDEILEAFSQNEKWSDDLYNYITRLEVNIRTAAQKQKWGNTEVVLYALKDLDSL
jgi:hypothetical protein